MPVLCAYLFFLLGVVLQRLVMLPVASAVFQQEAAEGAFRYAHTRFRAWAAEIAMYRCGVCCCQTGSFMLYAFFLMQCDTVCTLLGNV